MVTQKVIEELYKAYRHRPASTDDLDIELLFTHAAILHGVSYEGDDIVIDSIPDYSPFHRIGLGRVHGIVGFERNVAIVLHSAIIFLDNDTPDVNIHLRSARRPWWKRAMRKLIPSHEH